jgi:prepilin signal peptidase PulO-like enzyme (type II secretory pathway)
LHESGIATGAGVVAAGGASLRHPAAVAPLTVAVAAAAFAAFPLGPSAFIAGFLAAVLVVVAAIDIERRIIPNRIVMPATAIVLVVRLAFFPGRALEWAGAAVLAGLLLLLPRLRNAAAMGMGDVKLAILIGAALGWGAFVALPVAFACIVPAAVFVVARGGLAARKAPLPFGPFLALGALFVLFIPYLTGSPVPVA